MYLMFIFDRGLMSTCFSFCNHQLGESEQQSDRETWSKPSQRPKASSSPGQIVNSSQETTRAQSRRQQTQSACRRAKVCECGDYYFNFLICKCCCFFSCQLALSYFWDSKMLLISQILLFLFVYKHIGYRNGQNNDFQGSDCNGWL